MRGRRVREAGWEAERVGLGVGLELDLTADGAPANPLVVLDLERWRGAPDEEIGRAAGLVAAALPITVGVLRGPLTPGLAPLAAAATLTLADGPASVGWPARAASAIVPVEDIPGPGPVSTDLETAVDRLRDAVSRSPRAAVACGQLVRQTAVLGTGEGLAAEATAYSLLLGGPEFARWLGERDRDRGRGPARLRAPNQPAEPVLVTRDDARLSIVLNVPERRNAFSAVVREALLDAVLLAEADPTIESVELSGAGPAFCSGGDLDEFGTATDLVAACLVRLARAPWRVIERIGPKVTVVAHGACVGAGTEIAAYAGRVVAAPDAFFALPEVRMGLVPGAGGSVSVVRRIGRWRAAWLMLTGERLPAATALRWGLVDEIAPPRLQRPEALKDPAEQALVGDHPAARRGLHHLDQVLVEKVAEQHPDHAEREPDQRGDLGHADRDAAELEDLSAFGAADRLRISRPPAADDHVDQIEVPRPPRPRPAAGHGVRPGDRPGLLVGPSVVLAHGPGLTWRPGPAPGTSGSRSCAVRPA
jgi:enoyl-CoA hydratase/carnithine racemase